MGRGKNYFIFSHNLELTFLSYGIYPFKLKFF
jgi:hypothetical protein